MRRRIPGLALLVLFLSPLGGIGIQATDSFAEPARFFREFVRLNDDQIREIREGRAVAKILDVPTADQVFVFESVYLHSTPERYLKFASDIGALRKLPSYLELREFSDPPQLAALAGFTLDDEEFKQLKNCKSGHCEVQLPTEAMEEFQRSVNWSAPDAADQANHLAQQMAMQALLNYQQGGNAALGTYRDKNHPAVVADTFAALLSRSKALPVYLPELRAYLLNYPKAESSGIQSEFYWERVPGLSTRTRSGAHGRSPGIYSRVRLDHRVNHHRYSWDAYALPLDLDGAAGPLADGYGPRNCTARYGPRTGRSIHCWPFSRS